MYTLLKGGMMMRKLLILTVTVAMLFAFVSCKADAGKESTNTTTSGAGTINDASNSGNAANSGISSKNATGTVSNGVIAKSGNAVTDTEKKKLLDNLEKELDSLLNDIQSMEDVSDTDLSTSGLN